METFAEVPIPAGLPERLAEVMAAHPSLSAMGLNWAAPSPEAFERDREDLKRSIGAIAAAMVILTECPRTQTPAAGSYLVKHAVERIFQARTGRYCGHASNGCVIAAALLLGIEIAAASAPNARLSVSGGWLNLAEKAAKRGRKALN